MRKRIAILAEGTLGDLVPYLEVARVLRRRGHEVHFASHEEHRTIATSACDDFVSLHANSTSSALKSDAKTHRPLAIVSLLRRMLHVRRHFRPRQDYLDQIEALCKRVDLATYHALVPGTADACEAAGIPSIALLHTPLRASWNFARPVGPVGLHRYNWGPPINWASHQFMSWYGWWAGSKALNEWRTTRLGLGRRSGPGETGKVPAEIYLFSPVLLAKPESWPRHVHVAGFSLPDDLRGISVAAPVSGSRRVYVYFGSNYYVSAALLDQCVRAIRQAGAVPAVSNRTADQCPGDWVQSCELIPNEHFMTELGRASAIMHHAGAGTCAIALRAGLPSICIPFFSEQRFWAGKMERLGVAVRSYPFTQVTVEKLAAEVERAVTLPRIRNRCQEVAALIRSEDGASRAADIIEESLSKRPGTRG